MGSPSFAAEAKDAGVEPEKSGKEEEEEEEILEIDEEIEEIHLEPYESPSRIEVAAIPESLAKAPVDELDVPTLLEPPRFGSSSAPPFSFSPERSAAGYGASKASAVWAEPPPPAILMDQPSSALGWAVGGIVVGLLLLGLVVWVLIFLVRHFI